MYIFIDEVILSWSGGRSKKTWSGFYGCYYSAYFPWTNTGNSQRHHASNAHKIHRKKTLLPYPTTTLKTADFPSSGTHEYTFSLFPHTASNHNLILVYSVELFIHKQPHRIFSPWFSACSHLFRRRPAALYPLMRLLLLARFTCSTEFNIVLDVDCSRVAILALGSTWLTKRLNPTRCGDDFQDVRREQQRTSHAKWLIGCASLHICALNRMLFPTFRKPCHSDKCGLH